MKTLIRSMVVVAIVVLLMVVVVQAQVPSVRMSVAIPVDSNASSNLEVVPSPERGIDVCEDEAMGDICITAGAIRPGDQVAYELTVVNSGNNACRDVMIANRVLSDHLSLLMWPAGELASRDSTEITVVFTMDPKAPDMTTQTLGFGLLCVQ